MINYLKKWNKRFDLDEVGAAIYTAWEFEFASYF